MEVSHLQYDDDTLILDDHLIENSCAIKLVTRRFGFALGLRVNFRKSNLIKIIVDPSFLHIAEDFLHCKVAPIPFRDLWLPIEINPRLETTREPLVNLF